MKEPLYGSKVVLSEGPSTNALKEPKSYKNDKKQNLKWLKICDKEPFLVQ